MLPDQEKPSEKVIVCWNCLTVVKVKEEWNIVECSFCHKLNRVPHEDTDNKPDLIKLDKNFNHFELNIPYVYSIVSCPFCFTENRYRKNAEQVICYKCQHSIPVRGALPREENFQVKTPGNFINKNIDFYSPLKGIFPQPIIFNFENPCDCQNREKEFYLGKIVKKLQKRNERKFKPIVPFDLNDPVSDLVRDIKERKLSGKNKGNGRYIYDYKNEPDGFVGKGDNKLFYSFSPVKVQSINKLFFDYL